MPVVRRAVYPGSFNPPTVAHLAIATAAVEQRGLDAVDLALSKVALAKETVIRPPFDERVEVVRQSIETIEWLSVIVTDKQLIADIADGYDVVIMGADKWEQLQDPTFYDSPDHRDTALASLPELAIAARPPHVVPAEHLLTVDAAMLEVSSTAARTERPEWMTPAARDYDARTGAWS